jgi:hypothetical protein
VHVTIPQARASTFPCLIQSRLGARADQTNPGSNFLVAIEGSYVEIGRARI